MLEYTDDGAAKVGMIMVAIKQYGVERHFKRDRTGHSAFKRGDLGELTNLGRKFQIKSIYGVNGERKLDWPEHSLDTPPQLLPSSSKLRRVWSSSARIGFSWMKKPLILASQDFEMNDGLRRVYRSSGNLVSVYAEQQQDEREVIDSLPDISA
ncbi:hypothetical protein AAC387_Pa06g0401 [Persea americana]